MRKIILGVATTLDNFIEGPNGEYDWCFTDQDYGMADFLAGIDAIFYGRKSYEMMKGVEGGNMFSNKKEYVFSTTGVVPEPGVQVVKSAEEARKLKEEKGKDIWLFGGASLSSSLLNAGLIDEMWLAVHPILLGRGKTLFTGLPGRTKLRLLESKAFDTGLVSLRYAIERS
jgi:dihydrofolate reductase